MQRTWVDSARSLARQTAVIAAVATLTFAGVAPATAATTATAGKGGADTSTTAKGGSGQQKSDAKGGSGQQKSDHSKGNASTQGDPSAPQPQSTADQKGGGANGQCPGGPYCSTRDGSPSGNGNGNGQAKGKPCAGCVGKADNKNPKGQNPNGSDHNAGYECDRNHGIGRSNPAHTGCTTGTQTPPPGDDQGGKTPCTDSSMSQGDDCVPPCTDDSSMSQGGDCVPPCTDDSSMSQGGDCVPPCTDDSSMGQGDDCVPPCTDDSSMNQGGDCVPPCTDDSSMSEGNDCVPPCDSATGYQGVCVPVPGGTTPGTPGANRPPVVAGVQAFATGPQVEARSAVAPAEQARALPLAGLLPNTGAGAGLLALVAGGLALLLVGGVTLLRRRGTQA